MTVKTATFNGVKYKIAFTAKIEGVTDTDEKVTDKNREMLILEGNDFAACHSIFHERLKANMLCSLARMVKTTILCIPILFIFGRSPK